MEKYYKLIKKENLDDLNNSYKYDEISNFIYEEKKSKFICFIFNITSVKEANYKLDLVRKKYFDAKHVVYLYSVFENNSLNIKFSDDGEPQGTGTKMILDMINKENISNTLIVIVRYFGGILLGAGPLARAYLNSFKGAYLNTSKKEILNYKECDVKLTYEKYNELINYIEELSIKEDIIIVNKEFNDKVLLNLKICDNLYDEIKSKFGGEVYE